MKKEVHFKLLSSYEERSYFYFYTINHPLNPIIEFKGQTPFTLLYSRIFHLYHGKKKLHFDKMMMMSALH